MEEVLSSIEPVVTEQMNRYLTAPYTQEEIVHALKHMHPFKAPGPDVITNRLKLILLVIIHESQSAFVPGHHITYNALIAFEIFHMVKLNKDRAHGVFAFKLDMAKAYDRVEWCFLESMMRHIGFHSSMVDLIMRCVTSVFFRVLVNGFPRAEFEPSRGLHKGDPLSHFFFFFLRRSTLGPTTPSRNKEACSWSENLPYYTKNEPLVVCGRLYCVWANAAEVGIISTIMERYEVVSGQKVNLEKSTIFFSGGVTPDLRLELANLLGVQCQGQRGSYLGIPSSVGRSKVEIFQMLVDRTRKKSKDWKRRFLFGAGKIVLIKAVLQAIPTYLMSSFAIPKQICQRLNSVAANFFWGQKLDERRIRWKSWNKLCMAKVEEGISFRDLSRFNQAMLAKQVRRLAKNETSLLARSLKARYFPRNDIFLASKAHKPSFVWTSLLVGRDLLARGMVWHLGDGARIRIGIDAWLPDGRGNYLEAQDMGRVAEVFPSTEVWKIASNLALDSTKRDRIFWPHGRGNVYTVKSGYHVAGEIHRRERKLQLRLILAAYGNGFGG
ncbi:uncharacterized protein LOC131008167 [Salvia miltiorrhiza]|uniref:uncharacterized protein LOC131008167 n=1 Tax=Salvia miltiorrhiza TaxID=226208 RepID=UPI0025AD151E|nr:uncharacterized protein LOC131008167 [Salvia miltiorrhiza]